jgi:hypothetical protein
LAEAKRHNTLPEFNMLVISARNSYSEAIYRLLKGSIQTLYPEVGVAHYKHDIRAAQGGFNPTLHQVSVWQLESLARGLRDQVHTFDLICFDEITQIQSHTFSHCVTGTPTKYSPAAVEGYLLAILLAKRAKRIFVADNDLTTSQVHFFRDFVRPNQPVKVLQNAYSQWQQRDVDLTLHIGKHKMAFLTGVQRLLADVKRFSDLRKAAADINSLDGTGIRVCCHTKSDVATIAELIKQVLEENHDDSLIKTYHGDTSVEEKITDLQNVTIHWNDRKIAAVVHNGWSTSRKHNI